MWCPPTWRSTIAQASTWHVTIRSAQVNSNRIHFDQDERLLPTTAYSLGRDRRPRGAGHLLQRGERVRGATGEGPGAAGPGDGPRLIAVGERRGVADSKGMVGPG